MYQQDYLMRQLEQAAQALGRILRKALGGDPAAALAMFDEAYQPLLGVGARVVSTLNETQLLTLLTSGSSPDLRRVASVLEVLKTEGDLYQQAGQGREAAKRYRRALILAGFLAARSEEALDRDVATALVGHAAGLDLGLSGTDRLQLAQVLEALGRYADAEDALFEAIDQEPANTALVDAGIAFYQRLLALSPEHLDAGGLPAVEVRESLAELLRRQVLPDDEDEEP
ncbi:MAG TPA: DUF6483 family protein [Actinomycetota bacterium]